MRKSITTTSLTCIALVAQVFCVSPLRAQTGNAYAMEVRYAKNPVSTNTYRQDTQKQTLINVLKELNKSKGIYFLFSEKGIDQTMVNPIPENLQNAEKILQQVLKNSGLSYKKISDNTYVIVADNQKKIAEININDLQNYTMMKDLPGIDFLYDVITGKVSDQNGNPLAGVSITIKGKSRGVSSGTDGSFKIDANEGDVLVFSYIGYDSKEITVGQDHSITISLTETQTQLTDVVVTTALGIQRQAKSLTYSVQKVNNADLTTVQDANFINNLTGRVAGVTISKSASGIGGSTRVILRGNKSTRENQPLYVIDGVPLVNYSPAQPNDEFGQSVGYVGLDGGDGISNLNPDDIENVTVLKGASAAALYGSSAANGVILITTKKGKAGVTKIDISSSLTFDNPLYKEPLQFKYGQTTPMSSTSPGSLESWGGIVNAKDYVNDFFQTGLTSFNSIALSGGTDKAQTYFSYSYTDNKGIVPTSTLKKHNINFRETAQFFDNRLTADFNVLFLNQNAHNRPASGTYDNPIGGLYSLPRGIDFYQYKNFETFSTLRNMYVQNWWDANFDKGWMASADQQNPYWLLNRNPSQNTLNRVYSNLSFKFKINDWLNIQARGNIDKLYNDIDVKSYATTSPILTANNGGYTLMNAVNTQLYGDLLLSGAKDLSDNIGINATIGTSITDEKSNSNTFGTKTGGPGLNIPNVFVLSNIQPNYLSISQNIVHRQVQSVFATASLNYKRFVYVDLSARNDWSSTFAFTPNVGKGYLYYAGGVNLILSEMTHLPSFISFGKLRVSYAKVGNDVNAYSTFPPNYYVNFDNTQPTSYNGAAPYPGTFLQPEDNRSFEAGLEFRFFNSKLGIDATYYQNNNYNQYLEVAAPNGSGYSTYFINGGNIRNQGVEVSIYATPIKSTTVTWNTSLNYALNKNKVVSLSNDQLKVGRTYYTLTGLGNLLYASDIVVGGSWGDIYGRFFQRDAYGNIVVDENGAPLKGTDPNTQVGDQGQKYLGNPNPKYTLGWSNSFDIKHFTVSFLFDGRFGGKVMSVTQAILDKLGDTKATQDARDAGGVNIPAVYEDGTKFNGPLDAQLFYQTVGGQDGISEYYMYDATNVRLRELALAYNFPVKSNWMRSLRLTLIGRNLFFVTKKAPFDPEISMSTNNGLQGTETFSIPSTRSIGLSLNIGF